MKIYLGNSLANAVIKFIGHLQDVIALLWFTNAYTLQHDWCQVSQMFFRYVLRNLFVYPLNERQRNSKVKIFRPVKPTFV